MAEQEKARYGVSYSAGDGLEFDHYDNLDDALRMAARAQEGGAGDVHLWEELPFEVTVTARLVRRRGKKP